MGDVAKGIKSFKKGMSENPSENPDANNKNSTTDDDNNSKQD
jgi:Sec-independent protein translocase protein TatA